MDKLGGFIENTLKRYGLGKRVNEGKVFERWDTIVGDEIAKRARPRAIRQGLLVVEAQSAAWSNQLSLLKPQILKAITKQVGPGVIKDIKFQITPWRETPITKEEVRQKRALKLENLSEEEHTQIQKQASQNISDPELSATVGGFIEILTRRKKAQLSLGYRTCSCGALYDGDKDRCPVCYLAEN